MPIFIKENQFLNKNSYKIPKELLLKLKHKLAKFSRYSNHDGFKRLNSLANPDYNKRSDENHPNGEVYVPYNTVKTIDHAFRHMSKDPNNFNRQINGGEEMAQFVSNTLKSERNKVEPIAKQEKVKTRDKNKTKPIKNPMKPIKLDKGELNIRESLIKENDYYEHPYYQYMEEYNAYNVIMSFLNKENLWTPLINPLMYEKALNEFTNYGYFINFPTKYIYQWMGIIMKNTAILRTTSDICGHSRYFPTDDIVDIFFEGDYEKWEEYKKEIGENNDYYAAWIILEKYGFDEWNKLPDGSDAISDYGIEPLEKIINEYNDSSTPEETIVIINKALDISHMRGDLASMFINGGSKILSKISENIKKNIGKKIYINENQLNILKNNVNI